MRRYNDNETDQSLYFRRSHFLRKDTSSIFYLSLDFFKVYRAIGLAD